MGKLNHGPSSRAIGKAGAWVYQQYEGMQVFREYNPNVKNPQTESQTNNRAKFKLSSQIVAQFKEVFVLRLTKLSIYTRIRRGAALKAIYEIASASNAGSVAALINNVVANINAKSVSGIAGAAITTSSGTHSVIAPDGAEVVVTVVDYDAEGLVIGITTEKYESSGTAKTFTPTVGYKHSVIMVDYAIATTENGRASIGNSGLSEDGASWDVLITRLVAQGDAEISNMTCNVITAA